MASTEDYLKDPELCVADRRGTDRRKRSIPVAVERRAKERREQQGERRRQIDPNSVPLPEVSDRHTDHPASPGHHVNARRAENHPN